MYRRHSENYDEVLLKKKWKHLRLSTDVKNTSSRKASNGRDRSLPQFSSTAFLDYLVSWIVADDQVSPNRPRFFPALMHLQSIRVVECPEFRQLCMVLRESLTDDDIPHRKRTREAIISQWKMSFEELRADLSVSTVYCCISVRSG